MQLFRYRVTKKNKSDKSKINALLRSFQEGIFLLLLCEYDIYIEKQLFLSNFFLDETPYIYKNPGPLSESSFLNMVFI